MRIGYIAVAATCAIAHNVIIIGLDWLGVHYVIASALSFVTVVTLGYLLHCAITFRADRSWRSFLRYGAAMGFNLPMSVAALFLFHDIARLPMVIASPAATVAMFVVNYFLSAWAIIGGERKAEGGTGS